MQGDSGLFLRSSSVPRLQDAQLAALEIIVSPALTVCQWAALEIMVSPALAGWQLAVLEIVVKPKITVCTVGSAKDRR